MNKDNSKAISFYSLRKSRRIMQSGYAWYKKKGKKLTLEQLSSFENDLAQLDQALLENNRENADFFARKVELFCETHFKKSIFDYIVELVIALVLALAIATVVRQMWFEPYEIPTGSMRPTFEEHDHLTVSKLAFGINCPLMTAHLYFNPDLVQRSSIVIFSGDGIALSDTDSTYFGLFPYKKRYIKRLIGKPGDSLYFYGGKIYGVDGKGDLITDLLETPWTPKIEHVPFLNFEGKLTNPQKNVFVFNQMNKPIGKLSALPFGILLGEVFNGSEWVKDNPDAQKTEHSQIESYSDFLGMRNYAMARLLTKAQLQKYTTIDTKDLGEGVMYLELRHHPSLTFPKPLIERYGLMLATQVAVIPLQQNHLDAIMDNMYTARFVLADGQATRYNASESRFSARSPLFPNVPNGTYEFYYGKAVKVGWGAITYALAANHPLYSHEPANIQKLYNLGIEMDTAFAPSGINQCCYPNRYAYFRDGDLYLLGAAILKKDDAALITFNEREQKRQQESSTSRPYIAFQDYGPPLKDNKIDAAFIRSFGITIPEKQYLVLGDNHAMSSDSRVFGSIPEANLQGAPSLIIWPPGDRLGAPAQKPYPIFNLPRSIVWGVVLLIAAIWYAIHRRSLKQPIFKKLPFEQK